MTHLLYSYLTGTWRDGLQKRRKTTKTSSRAVSKFIGWVRGQGCTVQETLGSKKLQGEEAGRRGGCWTTWPRWKGTGLPGQQRLVTAAGGAAETAKVSSSGPQASRVPGLSLGPAYTDGKGLPCCAEATGQGGLAMLHMATSFSTMPLQRPRSTPTSSKGESPIRIAAWNFRIRNTG